MARLRPPTLALTAVQVETRTAAVRRGLDFLVRDGLADLNGETLLAYGSARRNDVRKEVRQALTALGEADRDARLAAENAGLKAALAKLTEAYEHDTGSPYLGTPPATADDPPAH